MKPIKKSLNLSQFGKTPYQLALSPLVNNQFLIGALTIVFTLSLILLFPTGGFVNDWYNFLYMAGYTGEYFSAHREFPTHINSVEFVGNPFLVFYGFLLLPVWGFLSSFLGVHLSTRVLALLFFGFQYALVYRLGAKLSQSKTTGTLLAVLVTWAIYPLTNLYNRSALPECFASTLLVSAACAWYEVILSPTARRKWQYCLLFTFCTSLMAGSHAITAVYGTLWLAVLVSVTLVKQWRENWIFAALSGFVFSITLLPWVYVVKKYSFQTEMGIYLKKLLYYEGIDEWWIRLFPLPLDWRSLVQGTKAHNSFLDAQVNMPLFVLFLYVLFKTPNKQISSFWKIVTLACVVLSVLHFFISFNDGTGEFFEVYAIYFQIGYRAVTYVNFFLLIGIFILLKEVKRELVTSSLLVFLLTWAGAGLVLKLVNAAALLPHYEKEGYNRYTDLTADSFLLTPRSFYSRHDYTIPKNVLNIEGYKEEVVTAQFVPGNKNEFGKLKSVTVELKKPGWVFTNVASFPWNRIMVDGVTIDDRKTLMISDLVQGPVGKVKLMERSLAFPLETTGRHEIALFQEIDPIYLKLRSFGLTTFLLLFINLILVPIVPVLSRYKTSKVPITADIH